MAVEVRRQVEFDGSRAEARPKFDAVLATLRTTRRDTKWLNTIQAVCYNFADQYLQFNQFIIMKPSDAISANQAAWDEAAPRFKERMHAFLLERFKQQGFSTLQGARLHVIQSLKIKGKAVAQLCCNNGRELLSIKNLGAGTCVGFDISKSLIEQGRELAEAGGIDCELVATDIHHIPDRYDGKFDVVLVTAGSLRWMPNLNSFVGVAMRLLKPGGRLFINEMHPMLDAFAKDEKGGVKWERPYFHTDPIVSHQGIAYMGVESFEAQPHVWYHHKLSDVVSSVLDHNMELRLLDELRENISGSYDYLVPSGTRPPFSYVLVARKKVSVRRSVRSKPPRNGNPGNPEGSEGPTK